jgi:hypothetical protein
MGEKAEKVTGGCLCGAVRYEAIGDPFSVIHCHCSSCRRHTGAPGRSRQSSTPVHSKPPEKMRLSCLHSSGNPPCVAVIL